MKKNMAPLLAIAFIVAIISTGLFYGLFASKLKNESASSDLPRQTVVIASRKLGRGAVLVASDVRIAEMRSRTAFAGSFTAPEQVIGSTTGELLEENQVLTKSVLAPRPPTDATGIPIGMRALTIHIFESGGVLALLGPGSKVDVQAISDRKNAAAVRTILRNIEVLSTGTQPEGVAGRFSAPHVTVLVRPEEADLLADADTGTRLRLALRNRLDDGAEPRASGTISSAFSTRHEKPVRATED
jgi:Flp pilus assembly protein CpaB